MMKNVIKKYLPDIQELNEILCKFDPILIVKRYSDNYNKLLKNIEKLLSLKNNLQINSKTLLPRFCKTALSGAIFLSKFKNISEFYDWIDLFDKDDNIRPALPLLLSNEIQGFGFALACDFLKRLGYHEFCKPDVYLKRIFKNLNLCSNEDDYHVFKAITRVARNVKVTPYNVDTLFWHIGSGKFEPDKNFINYVKLKLES